MYVLQAKMANGWVDDGVYESRSVAMAEMRECQEHEPWPFRIVSRDNEKVDA